MSRIFWQAFGVVFSGCVGGGTWFVAHMIDLPQVACVLLAVFVFLGFAAAMHMFFAENGEPSDPQMREPYTAADKAILNEPYVPQALRRPLDHFVGEDDDTQVFEGRFFNLTRPKLNRPVGDQTHVMRADEVYAYEGRRAGGRR